jgi:hypothetical protein
MRILCAITLGLVCAFSGVAEATVDFVVAPDGKDSQPGTFEEPFATVQRAQQAVRGLIAGGLDHDVVVAIRGGRYELDETLVFGPADSGSAAFSVSYQAFEEETPILSGGRIVSGWKNVGGDLWEATVDPSWDFRQLFLDGERLPRGRFPNGEGLLHLEKVSKDLAKIAVDTDLPGGNLSGENAELVVIQNWSITRGIVLSSADKDLVIKTPMGWVGHPWTSSNPGKPAYLENARAFVDEAGEWYLDYETGVLTYQAASGNDPNQHEFIASVLEQLLRVEGSETDQARNLHFSGIAFMHADWKLPKTGYAGIQACHSGTTMQEPFQAVPGAIEFTRCENSSIKKSTLAHVGQTGVTFGPRTRYNHVVGCLLEDIGANGIMVGWRHKAKLAVGDRHPESSVDSDWLYRDDVPTDNALIGNILRNCGAVNYGAVGIFDAYCTGTRIAHNKIHDLPYTGISIGFRWSIVPSSQRNTLVEYNHVYNVMTKLADGGCLYTLGLQPGTIVRGNTFHDAQRSHYAHGGAPNNGIFFDEGSKEILVTGNTIYSCSGGPIRFNQTKAANMKWGENAFNVGVSHQTGPLSK